MSVPRSLLLIPLVAVIALAGCKPRGATAVTSEENSADNRRLAEQLQLANDENARLNGKLAQMSAINASGASTIGDLGGAGELPSGFERTESGSLALSEDFAFAKGSADLNAEGRRSVKELAARLSGDGGGRIIVEGHTDDTPVSRATTKEKYTDNWGLSAARAAEVVRELQAAGVPAQRLVGSFRGPYQPRGSDKAKNRRVELSQSPGR